MNKILKITLQSDLCAAVGKHFAAIIDLDTALDEYGLPYIPSKRLKGCLREIAEMFLNEGDINNLFGVRGNDHAGSIRIGDAKLNDYDNLVQEIKADKISPEKITGLFCSVRSETAIENDTAKDGSLRYIRVVNMLSPIDGKPLEFFAPIDFDCDEAIIEKLVRGLRNIGYHRNRGLGSVKCTLSDSNAGKLCFENDLKSDKKYELRYTVKLIGDLMLPNTGADRSMDYIPGTMVLGALAGKFAKKKEDADFNSLFYSDDVFFGNLYISDSDGSRFVPAPRFLAKIKAASTDTDKGIKNIIGKLGDKKQYKPLKSGYTNSKLGYKVPERKIVYHNGNTKSEEDQLLYMQYCICSGQYFSGSITAVGEKMNIIKELLSDGTIFFGRSKTAQYARCEICKAEIVPYEIRNINVEKGFAAYVLESDTVLIDKSIGAFSENLSVLCDYLNLNIEKHRPETSIMTKKISGYNSKWNMKKPQFPAFCAGSCIVFECNSDTVLPEYIRIGEKQNEGFGLVKLISKADSYTVENPDNDNAEVEINAPKTITELIRKADRKDFILEKAISFASEIKFNASQVGRIILMAKESDLAEGNKYDDFMKRVGSIKTESFRKNADSCFNDFKLKEIIDVDAGKSWDEVRYFILTALTVKKYLLRMDGKNND